MCIRDNENLNSLEWFDYENKEFTNTHVETNTEATVTSRKRKRSDFAVPAVLVRTPKSTMAMNKVSKWAAMAAEKQPAAVGSTSNKLNEIGPSATHNIPAVVESALHTSGSKDGVVDTPASTPTSTPSQRGFFAPPMSHDEPVTLIREQRQPGSRKPRRSRQIKHDEDTAHLFNNAGMLMPSIPGIDSVTERLFDQGKIMSLGQSRSHDGYYPDGEPRGGSFLLYHSSEEKSKSTTRAK